MYTSHGTCHENNMRLRTVERRGLTRLLPIRMFTLTPETRERFERESIGFFEGRMRFESAEPHSGVNPAALTLVVLVWACDATRARRPMTARKAGQPWTWSRSRASSSRPSFSTMSQTPAAKKAQSPSSWCSQHAVKSGDEVKGQRRLS